MECVEWMDLSYSRNYSPLADITAIVLLVRIVVCILIQVFTLEWTRCKTNWGQCGRSRLESRRMKLAT
ncbi:uncharacterized protein YALI1_F32056g [Yarrowia lipolytica]|uniref:Uncharacterized protein n=1 Tax=Yarrowia lipolytica TaxID=4952 RepID=A0A1D8NPU2_YARLL|nr:hypothetical protein YALI1_F32056g [Yarrowia lipolytica]